jgi:hypothetical protein
MAPRIQQIIEAALSKSTAEVQASANKHKKS